VGLVVIVWRPRCAGGHDSHWYIGGCGEEGELLLEAAADEAAKIEFMYGLAHDVNVTPDHIVRGRPPPRC
jgi:hypothetical protein